MKPIQANKTTLLTLLMMLALVSSAYAWGPGSECPGKKNSDGKKGGCHGKCLKGDMQKLTDEQKEQLRTLRQEFVDETAEDRIALNTAIKNLKIIMETSDPSKKEIKSLISEITELQARLMEKRIYHKLEARKIAPEQNRHKRLRACWCDNNGPFGGMWNMNQ